MKPSTIDRLLGAFRVLMAVSFVLPGVLHFTHDHVFMLMMPSYLPWHRELVWLSGVFEIALGMGLLVPSWRRRAAWGLLALLVAVFPANLHMALHEVYLPIDGLPQSRVGLWIRLPFQLMILFNVWLAGLWVPSHQREGCESATQGG